MMFRSTAVKSRDDTSRCANVIVDYIKIGLYNTRIYWYVSCIIRFLCLYIEVENVPLNLCFDWRIRHEKLDSVLLYSKKVLCNNFHQNILTQDGKA